MTVHDIYNLLKNVRHFYVFDYYQADKKWLFYNEKESSPVIASRRDRFCNRQVKAVQLVTDYETSSIDAYVFTGELGEEAYRWH